MILPGIFKMKPKLFDHGIGENVASDSLYFGVGRSGIDVVGQPEHEILSLPHVFNSLVAHLVQGAVDGLTLRIENRLLQRDIDMSLHFA